MDIEHLREAWKNAYYRGICLYIATIVTLIFGFQMYRYYYAAPSEQIKCHSQSAPFNTGVLFHV